ncbi:peptidase S10 family protein [Tieghemostelium lacteum]|uniref:Carboxypeptidase n=1 Tax=Tieghemostelium lacteum TaxID=361077 RepID=A0A151ZCN4_TIELA|nr:peptidase S10 family protein [Tieghemostelium lacteum]|eukprot:KYQ91708.1 peptidase S10 family protein [Tieghemostelium lacteum]
MNKSLIFLVIAIIAIISVDSKLLHKQRYETEFQQPKPEYQIDRKSKEYFDHSYLNLDITASPEDYLVTDLPGLQVELEHYAGLIQVDSVNDGNLFFWFFPAVNSTPETPFVIWINGGPGCSSQDGLFLETGPFRLKKNDSGDINIDINPWSWTTVANVLYIDQPVGTGLSYVTNNSGICTTDLEIEQDFYQFLQSFYGIFSNYSKNPLTISGESYAGHYIPHFSTYILAMNEKIQAGEFNGTLINLYGNAIGNGWTHPITQYDSYSQIAYGVGFIEEQQLEYYGVLLEACQNQIKSGNYNSLECGDVLNQLENDTGNAADGMVNVYDFTLFDSDGGSSWPSGVPLEQEFLDLPAVRSAIHATAVPHPWNECNSTVFAYLTNQDESSLDLLIESLASIKVMVYNGNYDIICNHIGTTEYLDEMQWSGAAEWANASRYIWTAPSYVNDTDVITAGYTKSSQNLTFVLVLDCSHMCPMDQPATTHEMISRFISGKSFNDHEQATSPYIPPASSPTPSPTPTPTEDNDSHSNKDTNNQPSKSKTLPTGAWIGIIIGGVVFGLVAGAFAAIFINKYKSQHSYTLLN